jgi:light-regulated signal transduction histidine kinase (bacteriophytochrome)
MPASNELDNRSCEAEPIRFPGAVQPHGALLVLEPASGIIEAASESCTALLGMPAEGLIGQHVGKLFGPATAGSLLGRDSEGLQQVVHLLRNGTQLSARPRFNDAGQVLVDVEIEEKYAPALLEIFYKCRRDLDELRRLDDVSAITREAARLIRAMTGFDRVMVYRFDAEWNGEVIAESCAESIEPFAGMRFPASDIPRQARELFQSCKVRLVADVMYVPSPLIARLDPRSIDLGQTSLRSVSPTNIEYLQNMGVRASLVAALAVDGRLWGLLIGHHMGGPKYLGPGERDAIAWLGEDIAALIGASLNRQHRARQELLAAARRRLVDAVRRQGFAVLIERGDADLLAVVAADGFAMLTADSVASFGRTPTAARIRQLAERRFDLAGDSTLFASAALGRDLGWAQTDDGVAGALCVWLPDRPDRALIWFRQEQVFSVRWGGDPDQPHLRDSGGRLAPRKSFAQFRKEVRGQAGAWFAEELASAADLSVLIEIDARHRPTAGKA